MGTQFWWFFDAVTVSVVVGFLYAAAAKGFNKGVFRFLGFLAAMAIGFYGSLVLQRPVYENLFRNPIRDAINAVVSDTEWDVFEKAAEQLAISASDDDAPDQKRFEQIYQEVSSGKTDAVYPDWFISSVCDVTENAISAHQKPHSSERMAVLYDAEHDYAGFCQLVTVLHNHDEPKAAMWQLEEKLYRPGYLHMVRMVLFLLLAAIVLLIFGIISAMAGDMEMQMHLAKADHALGILVGIAEAVGVLMMFIAAVQFIVTVTDGQMLVFNPETIAQTKLFHYLYHFIAW